MFKNVLFSFFLFLTFLTCKSQYYKDLGVIGGRSYFRGDWGANSFSELMSNTGFSAGIVYYLAIDSDKKDELSRYVKMRFELLYSFTDFRHRGTYANPLNTGTLSTQLRAMSGSAAVLNTGFQVEYFPFKTDDNNNGATFSPYLSVGFQINRFTTDITTTLGDINDPSVIPAKFYNGGLQSDVGITASYSFGAGVRIRAFDGGAFIVDGRFLGYDSDWVDGLNPEKATYRENKDKDVAMTINFGYVWYLGL